MAPEAGIRISVMKLRWIALIILCATAQRVSPEIPKNLDYRLLPGERTTIRNRLLELNLKMPVDHGDNIPANEDSRPGLFTFAREIGADAIMALLDPSDVPALENIATQTGIIFAVESRKDQTILLNALQGSSNRVGICADLNAIGDSFASAGIGGRIRQPSTSVSDFFPALSASSTPAQHQAPVGKQK
jgi:hypothetical protein